MTNPDPFENLQNSETSVFNQELHNDTLVFAATEIPADKTSHYTGININQFAILAELDAGDPEGENNRFVIAQNRMAPEGVSPYIVLHGYVREGLDADGQKQYGVTVGNRLEVGQPLELGRGQIGDTKIAMKPDETVSSRHATVVMSSTGELSITDHSANGTQLHYAKSVENQASQPTAAPVEQLPGFYNNPWKKKEQAEADPTINMLTNLRSELVWGRLDESRVNSLYSVARNIGDTELFGADQNGRIRTLLESSRDYSRPRRFVAEEQEHSVGTHSEWDKVLAADLEKLDKSSYAMADYFEAIGEPLKDRGDAQLAMYLGVAAHEAGHAMMSGVSRLIHNNSLRDKGLAATRTYLSKNPEAGFTGNWETDVAIQEERFAEGNAQVVLRKAFAALGYEPDMVEKIISYRTPSSGHTTTPEGAHQLDHLDKVTKDKTAAEVMAEVVGEADLKQHNQTYLGTLGYSVPLTQSEVAAQLLGLDELLRAQDTSGTKQDAAEWEELVAARQSAATKAQLEDLRQARGARGVQTPF